MNEIWKDIKGYEGLYQVSNLGNVKSLARIVYRGKGNHKRKIKEQLLKQVLVGTKKGYARVRLSKNNKSKNYFVHRLVATAFISNKNNLIYVNHKNEITTDNRASNLEWCDFNYNINYGTGKLRSAKTRMKKVKCVETNTIYESTSEASRKTKISQSAISYCAIGKRKSIGGYHWQYV